MTIKQQGFDLDHISESQPKVCPSAPDCPSALAKRVTGGKLSLPRRKLLSRCVRELLSGTPLSLLKPKLCSQRQSYPQHHPQRENLFVGVLLSKSVRFLILIFMNLLNELGGVLWCYSSRQKRETEHLLSQSLHSRVGEKTASK